jgi:hypothetical protein
MVKLEAFAVEQVSSPAFVHESVVRGLGVMS